MLLRTLLFLLGIGLISAPSMASLPTAVNGQKLPSLAPMLEQANPAVVNISTTAIVDSRYDRDPFFRFFESPRRQIRPASLGSGVIIDAEKGLVLTNHHVIQGAEAIKVSLVDGREFDAEMLGSDKETDVAVIKIAAENLTALPTGDSDALRVGDFVVAIGNPFSLGNSVTSGIVSAKGRQGLGIEKYEDFIQTDAAINPGNSGGALVNLRGELIGVNTAILGPSGGNVGIGFAIPIKLALNVMEQLLEFGEVRRGLLGVKGQDLTPRIANALGLSTNKGVIITRITENSAAEKAGVKQYDIITHLNGRRIRSNGELVNQLGLLPGNSDVKLNLIRDNREITINTRLDEPSYKKYSGFDAHPYLKGVIIGESSNLDEERAHLKVQQIDTNSRAYYAGLRKGDKIVGVGRYRIFKYSQLVDLASRAGRTLPLTIERNNENLLLFIK
ncbi:Do family serine endopeptidase [Aliikangiella coralliicola]|uniref:Do family serine endopeptidase n=1 Tax=Aliikangiella coralliicola TaxID=2592383 RepID=A0A545UK13_9GAMM|nr:Do family serine endopeptidase [Aliikangiella coralliicola]TQV89796.1 Do family serine endopeptidase [Aliikangiella coralliicola]